MKTIERAHLPN
jgi:protein MAK16